MNPLSATVGVIALTQAAVGIEYKNLLDEPSNLHLIVDHIQAIVKQFQCTEPVKPDSKLCLIGVEYGIINSPADDLSKVTDDLSDLCDRLKKTPRREVNEIAAQPKHQRVLKYEWQKEKHSLDMLRSKARTTREYLALWLSVLASSSSSSHRHAMLTQELQQSIFDSTQIIQVAREQRKAEGQRNEQRLVALQASVDQLFAKQIETLDVTSHQPNPESDPTQSSLRIVDSSWSASMSPRRLQVSLVSSCHFSCLCRCHQLQYLQSPGLLANLAGSLVLQRRGVTKCDAGDCSGASSPSSRITYALPRWLWARSVEIAVSWSALTGARSSLHLRIPRVIYRHDVWPAIWRGDLEWVRRHLSIQSVLPTDFDEDGQSLAIVALMNHQFEMAAIFAKSGCDLHVVDTFGRNAAMQARIILITNYSSSTQSDPIRHVLEEMSSCWEIVDDGASTSPLRYLQRQGISSPSTLPPLKHAHLSRLDQLGLAPLHWAARKRDLKLARTLLIAGAHPDVLDSQGMTPLCHAVGKQDVECVRLLLKAGADVNVTNRYGEAPIIYCFDRPDILQLLLNHGARLCQQRNSSGWSTPLGRAAFCSLDYKEKDSTTAKWSESLDLLVDAGLDINFPEGDWKQAPLSMALGSRNAPLVELLIEKGANLGSLDIKSNTILHYAARWAQKECIHALRRANISEIDPDAANIERITPMAILNQRVWAPENEMKPGEDKIIDEDFWAFTELIEEIRDRNLQQEERGEPIARTQTPLEHGNQTCSPLCIDDGSEHQTGGRKHDLDDSEDSDTDEFFDAEP